MVPIIKIPEDERFRPEDSLRSLPDQLNTLPVYVFTVIFSGHNNDQTKDAFQETHGAKKKYGITLRDTVGFTGHSKKGIM